MHSYNHALGFFFSFPSLSVNIMCLSYSDIYYQSELTTILPRPKLIPEWLVVVYPFNLGMWAAVFASIVLSAAALYLISKLSQFLLGRYY